MSYPFNIRQRVGNSGLTRLVNLTPSDLAPSVQSIPTTIAGINALSGRTFTEWYVCNQESGDLVGANGTTLTAPASGILFSRLWPGWNGADYTSGYRAIEFDGSGAAVASFTGSTSLYDLSQSITHVACLRVLRPHTATTGLFVKRASSSAANPGYNVTLSTAGYFTLQVADGTTLANINGPGVLNELDANTNGSPQWVAFKMDLTSGNATVMQFRNQGTATAMPTGSKTNASAFVFGGRFHNTIPTCQVLAWGVLAGADAEAFVLNDLNTIDNWCRVPDGTTFLRYSCVSPIVGTYGNGDVVVAHHAGSTTTTALNHFAHAYAAACTAPGSVGAVCERGIESVTSFECRNRLLRTDDLSDATAWTHTNITPTKNAGDDPSGFRGAAGLAATSSSATITQNWTGEASKDHTVSFFARRDQSANVSARLSLYNSASGTEIDGVDITIGYWWQRFSLSVAAATVGAVSTLQWRLTIATSGDQILATYAQGEYGWLRSYQPQRGSLVSRDENEWWIDNSDGTKFSSVAGRIEVTCTGLVDEVNSTGAFVVSTDCGAAFEDRLFIQRDALTSDYPAEGRVYDSAGTIAAQLTDLPTVTNTDEVTYGLQWDSRQSLYGSTARAVAVVNKTDVTTGAVEPSATWATGNNADRIMLGSRHSFSAHLEGIITSVQIWSGP